MDVKQIQELIRIITRTSISEIEIEEKDIKIVIRQRTDAGATPPVAAAAPVQAAPAMQSYVVPPAPVAAPAATPPAQPAAPAKAADNLITIKSPMIGTFYRRSSPDKPALVEVGSEVTPGKAVCIIEAMKLFNEIESEVSGTIVKVLVEDSSPVEYDQPLFLVEP
jgi:acetyl-CoA carboxylase biotin carboxyl carrier protein